MDLSAAWRALSSGLVPSAALGLAAGPAGGAASGEQLRAAAAVLGRRGLLGELQEWLLEVLQRDLQARLAPEFWSRAGGEAPCSPARLLEAFALLRRRLERYLRGLALLEEWLRPEGLCRPGGPRERAEALLRAVLFFAAPAGFPQAVRRFYGRSFRSYMQQPQQPGGGEEEEEESAGCGCGEEPCSCPLAAEQFQQLNGILQELNLLERVSADAVTHVLHRMIEERVERRCRGEYERSFLAEFQEDEIPSRPETSCCKTARFPGCQNEFNPLTCPSLK